MRRFARSNVSRSLRVAVFAVALLTFAAPAAHGAGAQYVVDGCRHADGSVAPLDGWRDHEALPPTITVARGCDSGGVLAVAAHAPNPSDLPYGVRFRPDSDVIVPVAATIWVWAKVPTNAAYATVSAGDETDGSSDLTVLGPANRGDSATPLAASNQLTVSTAHLGSPRDVVTLRVACATEQGACPADSTIALTRSAITLEDRAAPKFTALDALPAQLAGDGSPRSGTIPITVAASDEGSGVYRVALIVDGAEQPPRTFDANGGMCAPVAGSERTFSWRQPCVASGKPTISWASTTVPDGRHTIGFAIEDAAGNRTLSPSFEVTTKNFTVIGANTPDFARGAANGSGSSDAAAVVGVWPASALAPSTRAADRRRCKQAAFSRTHPLICAGRNASITFNRPYSTTASDAVAGRLTDPAGEAIGGATLELITRSAVVGAVDSPVQQITSATDGSFTASIPRRLGSLDAIVRYRARQADTLPAAELTLHRTVQAASTIKAPSTAAPRAKLRFSGKLKGRTGRLDGVPITLEVRASGRWLTFGTTQTTVDGAWSKRIRFARTHARYPVRARIGTSVAYPYAPGLTESVFVRVG